MPQNRRLINNNTLPMAKQQPSGCYQLIGSIIFLSLLSAFGPAYSSELQPIPDASTTTQDPKQQLLDQMQEYRNREAARAIQRQKAKEAAAKRAADSRARQLEIELMMWPQYGSFRVYWPGWNYDKKTRSWLTLTRPAEKPEMPKSVSSNFQPATSRSGPPDPLRPDPSQLSSEPPARFDASLDALVRDGIATPSERSRLLSGGGTTPLNDPAYQQACSNGSLSEQECRTGLVVRWGARGKRSSIKSTYQDQSPPPTPSGVAVDCTALMLNLKPYDSPYSGWFRPIKYSAEERLVVDFCASQISRARP